MEAAGGSRDRLCMVDVEREQLIAALCYYRAALAKAPGNELTVYLMEMTIVELSAPPGQVAGG